MGESVPGVTFKEVFDMSMGACIEARSRFLTGHHLLLACMADSQVRLILAAAGTRHDVLIELLMEYLERLPPVAAQVLSYTPRLAPSFGEMLALLDEKRKEYRIAVAHASHFLEAYARFGMKTQDEVEPALECVIPTILGGYHSKIALAVYGELPGAYKD